MAVSSIRSSEVHECVGDAYEIIDELGSGGFATVFHARQLSTGQPVAIKIQRLPDQGFEEGAARRARFERETKLCAALNHPRIVRLLDRGQAEPFSYLVFEYVPGETLRDSLTRNGALEVTDAVLLMTQVLDALDAAHAKGVVHRDLKPENLMIVSSGPQRHIKVLDFGAGMFLSDTADGNLSLTRSHEIIGTPSYASPEQLRGEPATTRSDIYAWGLVLLECLTGERVMDGATLAEVFHKQLSALEVQLPASIATHPLGEVLRRALRKSPAERAGEVRQLWSDLQGLSLNALVGPIASGVAKRPLPTQALRAPFRLGEQRQATVLCCSLSTHAVTPAATEAEDLDVLEKDQLNLCTDVITRFGGYIVGRLGNRVIAVFGLPHASDNDVRCAGRAAMELRSRIESRRPVLLAQRGVDLKLRIGIDTGTIVIGADGSASGPALNAAARLEGIAGPDSTLVSEVAQALLRRYLTFRPVERSAMLGQDVAGIPYSLLSSQPIEPARLAPQGSAPVIGRERELAELLAHWHSVRGGRGRVVVIKGEAGIGKSRLVHELEQHAANDGAELLQCRCLPEERHTALHALLPLLRRVCQVAPGEAIDAAALENALAACGVDATELLGIFRAWSLLETPFDRAPIQLSPQKQKLLLLDALSKLLCTNRHAAPRLLVIEDVHWADPTTRELVALVKELAGSHQTLLVLTSRSELDGPLAELEQISLPSLSYEAARALLAELADDSLLEQRVLDELVQRSDGVPLFLEELARSVRELASTGPATPRGLGDIPLTLRDLLVEQLDRLGDAKAMLQLAAAIGREFSLDLLRTISEQSAEQLEVLLVAPLAGRVLVRKSAQSGPVFEFRHALIHEAAASSMLASQRRAVHRTIASTLEAAPGPRDRHGAALLAWHYEHADLPEPAIHHRFAAGMRALEISAYVEAFEHFEHAKGILPRIGDRQARLSLELDLHNALGGLLVGSQGLAADSVVATYRQAERLLREGSPSVAQSAMTLKGLWTFHNARAEYPAAAQLADELLALASELGTPEALLLAHDCAGQTAVLTGDFEKAVSHAGLGEQWLDVELQRGLAARHGVDPGLALQSFACIADVQLGNVARALKRMARVLESATELGVPSLQAAMNGQSALLHFFVGSCGPRPNPALDTCLLAAERALDVARRFGFPFWEAFAGLVQIMASAIDGDPQVLLVAEQATMGWRMSGARAASSWHSASLAIGQCEARDFAAALRSATAALEHCEATGEGYGRSEAQRVLGIVLGHRDNPKADVERSYASFEQAIATARKQNAHWLELRAGHAFATTLGWHENARPAAALSAPLEWFESRKEALDTPLVSDARRLLDQLV